MILTSPDNLQRPVPDARRLRCRRLGQIALVCAVGSCLLLGNSPKVSAQQGGFKRPALKKAAPSRPDPKSGRANPTKAPTAAAEKKPPDIQLPPGFQPPDVIPEIFRIEKPLLTDTEERQLARDYTKYRKAAQQGVLTQATEKLITNGARWRLYKMTMKENREKLAELREEILRDVRFASKAAGAPEDARKFLLGELTRLAPDLFDGNYYVRLNAVQLLGQLDEKDANLSRKIPRTAFTPAATPLLKFVQDPKQPEEIKVIAVKGLSRISRIGKPSLTVRQEMARTLVDQLKNPDTHYWYQQWLAEALADVGVVHSVDRKPFVVQILGEVMKDGTRDWRARTAAAKALGRLPLDASIPIDLIVYAVADLSNRLALAYNKNPRLLQVWKYCFIDIYLAFHHEDDEERNEKAGFNNQFPNNRQVNDTYQLVVPLVAAVLNQNPGDAKPIPNAQLQPLQNWLKDNVPSRMSITPNQPPILSKQEPGNKEPNPG